MGLKKPFYTKHINTINLVLTNSAWNVSKYEEVVSSLTLKIKSVELFLKLWCWVCGDIYIKEIYPGTLAQCVTVSSLSSSNRSAKAASRSSNWWIRWSTQSSSCSWINKHKPWFKNSLVKTDVSIAVGGIRQNYTVYTKNRALKTAWPLFISHGHFSGNDYGQQCHLLEHMWEWKKALLILACFLAFNDHTCLTETCISINTGSDLISIRARSSEAVKLLQNGILLLNRHKKAEVGLKWSVFKSHFPRQVGCDQM